MRTAALLFVTLIAALFAFAPTRSDAAPTYKATLSSSDAGPTQAYAITPNRTYCMRCAIPACMRTDTTAAGAQSVTCATSFPTPNDVNTGTGTGTLCFDSAGHSYLAARAFDGGSPACLVWQDFKNDPRITTTP